MRCGVAVAADHDHPRAHESLLIHYDVLNTLIRIVGAVKGVNTETAAVGLKRLGLNAAFLIVNAAR